MELSSVLTEEEISGIAPEIVAKLESAFSAASASDSDKQRKQVDKMLEAVSTKADTMIAEAVAENISKMQSNALNDKMYKVLCAMSACLESAGITLNNTTTERLKRITEERDKLNKELSEVVKKCRENDEQYNDAIKENRILKLAQGMKPSVVQVVKDHFMKSDIRDITTDSIMEYIQLKSNDEHLCDIDFDADDSKVNMDSVYSRLDAIHMDDMNDAKLDVIDADDGESIDFALSGDEPFEPKKKKPQTTIKMEALSKGLKPQRVPIATPNMVCEATDTPVFANDEVDVADAMAQVAAYETLGIGKFS